MSPYDGTDLLDADGDESNKAEVRRIKNEHTACLQRLESGGTKRIIAIATLRLVPNDDATSGMNAGDDFLLNDRAIAWRMETMVVKDIEDDMSRLSISKHISIRSFSQQIKPIIQGTCLDRSRRNNSVTWRDDW